VLPPTGKKGLKPFLAGMEPRYQASYREEVLGEPLTKEEVPETDAEQAGRHMPTLRAGRDAAYQGSCRRSPNRQSLAGPAREMTTPQHRGGI